MNLKWIWNTRTNLDNGYVAINLRNFYTRRDDEGMHTSRIKIPNDKQHGTSIKQPRTVHNSWIYLTRCSITHRRAAVANISICSANCLAFPQCSQRGQPRRKIRRVNWRSRCQPRFTLKARDDKVQRLTRHGRIIRRRKMSPCRSRYRASNVSSLLSAQEIKTKKSDGRKSRRVGRYDGRDGIEYLTSSIFNRTKNWRYLRFI